MIQFCSQAYFETLFHDEHILGNIIFTSCIVCFIYIYVSDCSCWKQFDVILLLLSQYGIDLFVLIVNIKALSSFHAYNAFVIYCNRIFSSLNMNESTWMQHLTENHSQSCSNFVYYVHVSVFLIYLPMWTISV